jgi:heme-degrading monooxygenase HmoA
MANAYAEEIRIHVEQGQLENATTIANQAVNEARNRSGFQAGVVMTNPKGNHLQMLTEWRSRSDLESNTAENPNYRHQLHDLQRIATDEQRETFEVRQEVRENGERQQ